MSHFIEQLAARLGQQLKQRDWKISTAESCTGGGLAAAITTIPGSSAWFERGFVTYSNDAKVDLLKVHRLTLDTMGAVSDQTAREMAEGALANSKADISISITGIAGPTGGTPDKPVGTVWFGWKMRDTPVDTMVDIFNGPRHIIREHAIRTALEKLLALTAAQQEVGNNG